LRNCPARKPQRLAATIRGTKPSTACQALARSHPGAAGAESTTRNVTDAISAIANPRMIARRASRIPYTSASRSPRM